MVSEFMLANCIRQPEWEPVRAYRKAGNGNEMETENWKLETEMNAPITDAMFSSQTPSSVLCHWHYSRILLSNGYMTGFMSLYFAFTLVLCFVITYSVWLTGALVASDVAI